MDRHIYDKGILAIGDRNPRRIPRGNSTAPSDVVSGGGTPLTLNPITVSLRYVGGSIAPHAITERARYTVPLNRRAKLETANANIARQAAAAGAGTVIGRVSLIRAGTDPAQFVEIAKAIFNDNGINAVNTQVNPGPIELFAGDVVLIETLDVSPTGAVTYVVSATITEFDSVEHVRSNAIGAGGDAGTAMSGSGSGSSGGTSGGGPVLGYIGTGGINSGIPIK